MTGDGPAQGDADVARGAGDDALEDERAPAPRAGVPAAPRGRRLPWRQVDVIGDVHGCHAELVALLQRLGYRADARGAWRHPEARRLVFVGDLCNRGPATLAVLDLVAATVAADGALTVLGNHDHHVLHWLQGQIEPRDDDLEATAAAYAALPEPARARSMARHKALLAAAPLWALLDPDPDSHAVSADGQPIPERLAVAHAAWRPEVMGAEEERARPWCLYGPFAGRDENDRPRRLDWPRYYPQEAPFCIVGHTAYDGPVVIHRKTLCIDTACAYGGRLSALRWPARSVVQEPAQREWHHHPALGPTPGLWDPEELGRGAVVSAGWGEP